MIISVKKLLNLPVFTQSGERLGEVGDVNLDAELHVVREYLVKKNFFNKPSHLIKPSQVREITAEKMIVDDGLIKDEKKESKEKKVISPAPAFGNVMASEE
jgi:sporulation protein YlmC with PRC-barrel domain